MWNTSFCIGNGETVDEDNSTPVYREYYNDCEITMTRELFNELIQQYKIYYETNLLKNIVFTPKEVLDQSTSDYYFCQLDVKFPRRRH